MTSPPVVPEPGTLRIGRHGEIHEIADPGGMFFPVNACRGLPTLIGGTWIAPREDIVAAPWDQTTDRARAGTSPRRDPEGVVA